MRIEFVLAQTDVYCDWSGEPPRYRCYVNDELFTERTWIWTENYLEEQLQILTRPGKYRIRYELVDTENARLNTYNYIITHGPAAVDQRGNLTVWESNYENA
jgi:hypothetical protein